MIKLNNIAKVIMGMFLFLSLSVAGVGEGVSAVGTISTLFTSVDYGTEYIKFELKQNYPNPFNPETIIEYSIAEKQFVKLEVFDMLGRKISTLVNGEKDTGRYKIIFNGENLTSGIYFYTLHTEKYTETKKLQVLK